MEALQKECKSEGSSLMDALISALADPVPFGADGEWERDTEFQENLVRILHTFSVQCGGTFSDAQRHALRGFFGGAERSGDSLGLSREEFTQLKSAIA
ncbi:hypothetical protein M404DRAFT_33324 [Pisolithus tinctorius Marx 270]|uniref:Uncharacterized protein n=2 Tax=Pisolithus TaxID=37467 RepID=A0A0C3NM53_PISTI|nr:hypothetical protein M404DRAFT_33324 [Pisolithus tinctorius Marx 270]